MSAPFSKLTGNLRRILISINHRFTDMIRYEQSLYVANEVSLSAVTSSLLRPVTAGRLRDHVLREIEGTKFVYRPRLLSDSVPRQNRSRKTDPRIEGPGHYDEQFATERSIEILSEARTSWQRITPSTVQSIQALRRYGARGRDLNTVVLHRIFLSLRPRTSRHRFHSTNLSI